LFGKVCAFAGAATATTASKAISHHFTSRKSIMKYLLRRPAIHADDGRNALAGASPSLSCMLERSCVGLVPVASGGANVIKLWNSDCRRRARRTCGCQCAEDLGMKAEVFETAPALGEIGAAVNVSPQTVKALQAAALATKSAAVGTTSPGNLHAQHADR